MAVSRWPESLPTKVQVVCQGSCANTFRSGAPRAHRVDCESVSRTNRTQCRESPSFMRPIGFRAWPRRPAWCLTALGVAMSASQEAPATRRRPPGAQSKRMERQNASPAGTRTRVSRVRAVHPNQLDYRGRMVTSSSTYDLIAPRVCRP